MYVNLPLEEIYVKFVVYDKQLIHSENPLLALERIALVRLHEAGAGYLRLESRRSPRDRATEYVVYGPRYITDGCPVRYEP